MNLEKAYGRISCNKLRACRQTYGLEGKLLQAIQSLRDDGTCYVRVSGDLPFSTLIYAKVVFCPLPCLCMDGIVRSSQGDECINVNGETVEIGRDVQVPRGHDKWAEENCQRSETVDCVLQASSGFKVKTSVFTFILMLTSGCERKTMIQDKSGVSETNRWTQASQRGSEWKY
ncbi:unnamed protein product [Soboliphyme baturini]|uniref:Reverse transcriptase domain-containing protein n=1 Tax=Soboliphyme baturini TaxID=241478 RepID=A0A183IBR5_9BILA|nr:unnamed protein product [Soboliphyme baturini]